MISIIIVNYRVKKELFACIASIIATKPKASYEIIVVDNDEKKELYPEIKNQFPKVIYIRNKNKGYGQGMNIGAKRAKGEYLFILNPDTKMHPQCIDLLIKHLKENKEVGVAAPLLYDMQNKVVPLQGARTLTPLSAIFSFSFIHKIFPQNPWTKKYWYLPEWKKRSVKEVESVPGAALVIRSQLFRKLGGFDERFFLYFEEHDLCKRVRDLGWKITMLPQAKVSHVLGESTKKSSQNISNIFNRSRFYYFRKHFGLVTAMLTEAVLRTGKTTILLTGTVLIGLILRLHHIDTAMAFIGDQAWFYLSARDMILSGQIPLVGIASSHPWLHQGALWTYLLAFWMQLFGFNPLNGAYLSILFDVLAIVFLYLLGKNMFSQKTGLFASMLYATSPLVIANARMPYHTSPIPLFTILFLFALYRFVSGNKYYFPLLIALLGILYNLEIATFLLTIVTAVIVTFGLWYRKKWARNIFDPKILALSLFGFFVSLFPMLVYDVHHGFPQTIKFLTWIGYKVFTALGFFPSEHLPISSVISFSITAYKELVYPLSGLVAFIITVSSMVYLLIRLRRRESNSMILFVSTFLLIVGFLIVKTPSSAYLPIMFPGLLLIIALFFDWSFGKKYIQDIFMPLFIIVILFNCFFVQYRNSSSYQPFAMVLSTAQHIVNSSAKKEYNIEGRGNGSQFESFTMNYEYLTWWLGHAPSKEPKELRFIIEEQGGKIKVTQSEKGEK